VTQFIALAANCTLAIIAWPGYIDSNDTGI